MSERVRAVYILSTVEQGGVQEYIASHPALVESGFGCKAGEEAFCAECPYHAECWEADDE